MQDIIWKADCHSACQKILLLYGTRRYITVLTKARHWTLPWVIRIQFAPSIYISLRSILILSSHLRLDLPSGFFPWDLPTSTHLLKHKDKFVFTLNMCTYFKILVYFSKLRRPRLLHLGSRPFHDLIPTYSVGSTLWPQLPNEELAQNSAADWEEALVKGM
jgi:hypothetical protein